MKLYLVRHGDAEHSSRDGDKGRVLTELGKEQSRKVGSYLANLHPGVVLSSTYARAKETLGIIRESSNWSKVREFESLDIRPGGDMDGLLAEIEAYNEDSVLVVGHNPQLTSLINYITGDDCPMGNCSFAQIDLKSKKLDKFKKLEDM